MKKLAIVGAGNMGGAVAYGLLQSSLAYQYDIWVADMDQKKLSDLQRSFPTVKVTRDNKQAADKAEIVIMAVKPWLVQPVLKGMELTKDQLLVSIAAGVSFKDLAIFWGVEGASMMRAIPNTAIKNRQSMTMLCQQNTTKEQQDEIMAIFNELGSAIMIDESKMAACTAVSSCGIAYVLKYVQAATQASVELGLRTDEAKILLNQTLKGAASLLEKPDSHPSVEIDKVCTPGGITIKGINTLDEYGFTNAIIQAIKASR